MPATPAWDSSSRPVPAPQQGGGSGGDQGRRAAREQPAGADVTRDRSAGSRGSAGDGDEPPGDGTRLLRPLLAAGAGAAVIVLVIGAVLAARNAEPQEPARPAVSVSAEPAPADATFDGSECGPWEPRERADAQGWLYRACIHRQAGKPGMWLVGAQVRNIRKVPSDIRVYLNYLSSSEGAGAPVTLRQGTVGAKDVEPKQVVTVTLGLLQHPGADACAWTEVAPLFLSENVWGASRGVRADGGACTPVGSAATG